MSHMDIDTESLSLALRLQYEDLETPKERELSDTQHAVELYENELALQQQYLSDLVMAMSIAGGADPESETINTLRADEEQAAHDGQAAISLGSTCGDVVSTGALKGSNGKTPEEIAARNNHAAVLEDPPQSDPMEVEAESSASASARPSEQSLPDLDNTEIIARCDSCYDECGPDGLADCNCAHRYCCTCLKNLFQSSLGNEGLFSPRCCKQPISADGRFLSPQLVGQFRAKKLELETPNRTYCHEPSCSTFVPPLFIREIGRAHV